MVQSIFIGVLISGFWAVTAHMELGCLPILCSLGVAVCFVIAYCQYQALLDRVSSLEKKYTEEGK